MMALELRQAIDQLALHDCTVYAALMAARRQGLSEVDTLANIILHQATAKAAIEAELYNRVTYAAPAIAHTENTAMQPLTDAEVWTIAKRHGLHHVNSELDDANSWRMRVLITFRTILAAASAKASE